MSGLRTRRSLASTRLGCELLGQTDARPGCLGSVPRPEVHESLAISTRFPDRCVLIAVMAKICSQREWRWCHVRFAHFFDHPWECLPMEGLRAEQKPAPIIRSGFTVGLGAAVRAPGRHRPHKVALMGPKCGEWLALSTCNHSMWKESNWKRGLFENFKQRS